ncbi:hypothetical protein CSB45_04615 [candidate division KSB3 bacterium]|uniref:Uncharacterized protein n=1 Tax=candidate division KSB3 bacterium TaxID=2044937 RepID=A0A2G6E8G3_9BACT|nr:MAG: hypothetical protein CSB45_04615 [candidate division KSB3 bacterium]
MRLRRERESGCVTDADSRSNACLVELKSFLLIMQQRFTQPCISREDMTAVDGGSACFKMEFMDEYMRNPAFSASFS